MRRVGFFFFFFFLCVWACALSISLGQKVSVEQCIRSPGRHSPRRGSVPYALTPVLPRGRKLEAFSLESVRSCAVPEQIKQIKGDSGNASLRVLQNTPTLPLYECTYENKNTLEIYEGNVSGKQALRAAMNAYAARQ
jgi:hypothetical protein